MWRWLCFILNQTDLEVKEELVPSQSRIEIQILVTLPVLHHSLLVPALSEKQSQVSSTQGEWQARDSTVAQEERSSRML